MFENGNIKSNSISLSKNLARSLYHFSLFQSFSFLTHTFIPPIFSKPCPTVHLCSLSSDPPLNNYFLFSSPSLCTLVHRIPLPAILLPRRCCRTFTPSPPPPLREGEGVGLPGEQEDSCEETSAARGRLGGWSYMLYLLI
jgi:hypothetical protein